MNEQICHQNGKIDLKIFFENTVTSELRAIWAILNNIELTEENNIDIVKCWWNSFADNSVMLGILLEHPRHSYYQFAMTIRLLLEIAIDLTFISNNRKNIPHLRKQQAKVQKRMSNGLPYTYVNVAEDVKKFQLYLNIYDNKNVPICTKERIKLVNSKQLPKLYSILCAASHFNHIQTIWYSNNESDKDYLSNLTYLVQFYPELLAQAVHSIGIIVNNNELTNYDNEKVGESLNEFHKKVNENQITLK